MSKFDLIGTIFAVLGFALVLLAVWMLLEPPAAVLASGVLLLTAGIALCWLEGGGGGDAG